jgi:hypothetical protein
MAVTRLKRAAKTPAQTGSAREVVARDVWAEGSARASVTLPEGRNARRFFRYYAGIVLVRRASRLALEHD